MRQFQTIHDSLTRTQTQTKKLRKHIKFTITELFLYFVKISNQFWNLILDLSLLYDIKLKYY